MIIWEKLILLFFSHFSILLAFSITSFRMTWLLYLYRSRAFLVDVVYKHFIIALYIMERLFPNSISRHALLSYRYTIDFCVYSFCQLWALAKQCQKTSLGRQGLLCWICWNKKGKHPGRVLTADTERVEWWVCRVWVGDRFSDECCDIGNSLGPGNV